MALHPLAAGFAEVADAYERGRPEHTPVVVSALAAELGIAAGAPHPAFDGPPWQEAVRAAGGWSEPRELRVTTTQPASPERLVAYIASISWIASLPRGQRERLVARAGELVRAGETPDGLPVLVTIGLATLL